MSEPREYSRVLALILEQLALVSGMAQVHEDERLGNIALDSIEITGLVASLGLQLGMDLDPTLFWKYPTPAELARHIAGHADDVEVPRSSGDKTEPLAISGLACRFPGAMDANAYWSLLINGLNAVGPLNPAHFSEAPGSPWHVDPGETAGFLNEVSAFDFEQFGIGAHEASCMDPQQRLLLELSWSALEQAGMSPKKIKGQRGGVYVGAMWSDFAHHITPSEMTAQSATGMDTSILSARLSFVLGLNGPSLTVNTACSSSLVALHLACQAIRNNDCDFAIVAGVNLLLAAQSFEAMRRFGGLSDTGLCHTFDAAADGYVRAEGCGVLIVRRLSQVLIEAGPVWGVIRSSVVNNNGFHASLTAPSVTAQQQLLREACAQGELLPAKVQYVEAHGTGTAMGDPIEVAAISAAYCQGAERTEPLLIGSVKTNIGHSEAAAGMAGLIKVLLAMRYRMIPPHLNYETSNPAIDWQKLGLQLVTSALPWETFNPTAGVSSFGFGGTNAHVIVSETWPCVSDQVVNRMAVRESDFNAALAPYANAPTTEGGRALLIFAGQGSHWQGMGRSYARLHPQFRKTVTLCDRLVRQLAGWSVAERLYDDQETFTDVRIAWPCHLVMQLAISEVWFANGLQPSGVIGHSIGEISAAHVAGLINLEDALRIVLAQAQWAHLHPGSMALVKLDWSATQELLEQRQSSARCAIQHCASATVITGSLQALRDVESYCRRAGTQLSMIKSTVSVHGQVSGADRQRLVEMLGDVPSSTAVLPFYSGIRGGELLSRLPDGYWGDTISRPLYWFDALQQAITGSEGALVEVAAHSVLSLSLSDALSVLGTERAVLISGRKGQVEKLSIGQASQQCSQADSTGDPWNGLHLLLLSGHSIDALRRRCVSIAHWLGSEDSPTLGDCAKALVQCADQCRYRLALIVSSHEEAIQFLFDSAAQAESVAHDTRGLAQGVLAITGSAPFDEEMCTWLRHFNTFFIEYSRVMLAGQDQQIDSPMLEAAAQQMGCIALLAEWGVSFDHYCACDNGAGVVQLIERRMTLNDFVCGVGSSSAFLDSSIHADKQGIHMSPRGSGEQRCPARIFLKLIIRCYLAGKSVDHSPGREQPLLTLPAMVQRSAGISPSLHPAEIGAQKTAAAYRLTWVRNETPGMSQAVQKLLVFADPEVKEKLQSQQAFSNAAWCNPSGVILEGDAQIGRDEQGGKPDFAVLFDGHCIETVVFVWEADQHLAVQSPGLATALRLVQYVQSMPGKCPSLLFVTQGAQAVAGSGGANPDAAMAWGLIRTAQLELNNVHCSLIDLDPPTESGGLGEYAIEALCASISTRLDQSAWREGHQFTPRLIESTDAVGAKRPPENNPTGFHLITGGLGALGLELLQSLSRQGERRFLLVGRTQPSAYAEQVVADLRDAGADILLRTGDVTCLESLSAIIFESAQVLGPLTAITHAAGVLHACSLATVAPADFEASLAAKKVGALNLHTISAEWPIQRFVLVSSISALFGFPHHASYAVANAYLDGLVGYRRARGLPGLSVCYGPFQDKGLLEKLDPALDFSWLQKMSMSEGLDVLNRCSDAQGVLAIMRYSGPAELGNAGFAPVAQRTQYVLQERQSQLREVIRRFVATLLQKQEQQVPLDTPLSELGVNSLLGVEVRNRLQNELSVRMPATVLWNYPTVSSLASYLETLLWPASTVAQPPPVEPVTYEVEDSEDALMAQLLDELATIKSTYKMGEY
ncbi:SDR family NAD(P)-dependent oxidoreductase [Pseudomonas fluorescens]|nr:type I polyketide synthase [Pseudomonas fluorescens]MBD8147157.1 SDR family NAD(P)-dependent oxidoreductase [Pseudomonas fluorescens]MBD8175629.1 SDR family NAD(P)-dependent oxidoreductase [Pseudomonas fluorescens]MBD8744084.1 SDR family NAD(P)-dependent oxidoreductase [Pseudomonas fluorescens]MBD8758886.1 SDR family NAD(P)-dependent oxidoreductase [Pseudomonas fluorescens]MBD8764416.1 SDR family NAD(P)-dependent oxidoreductase [Pseudomonas fluorescens]